jgi:pimeloyl-ACP methyl ester carboxylesterase
MINRVSPVVRSIRRGGVQISYRVAGDGAQTVVLLHGLAGHAGEWDRTIAALQPAYTVIAIDQRGHGRSTRRPADASREAFVEDVAAVIVAAGCPVPVTLVGQSMGAHTAFLTAAWHPELVERLVVAEGDIGGGGQTAAGALHTALASWPERFDSYEQVRDFFGGDTERGHAWARGYEQRGDGWWPRFDRQIMEKIMAPVFGIERWQEWESLRVPTLLVLAEHSGIDANRIEMMCQLRPSTQRVVITDAGHDVHLEQPDAWISTLQNFLTTTPTSQ